MTTCQRFIVLPVDQRIDHVKKRNLCLNCLSKGHGYATCPSRYSCRFCKQRHHSLLHKQIDENTSSSTPGAVHGTFQQIHKPKVSTVILATALVLVRDSEGSYHVARALLDSCSQVNFISESLSSALNLKKSKNSVGVVGIGSTEVKVSVKTQSTIRSRLNNFEQSLEFLISRKITGYHPDETMSIQECNLPSNIELADPEFHRRRGIDMLLGAEVFFTILSVGQIRHGENLPTLQKTLLGWVVSGKYTHRTISPPERSSFTIAEIDSTNINRNIEMLWELEEVEGLRQCMTPEQQQCEQHFMDNIIAQSDGRIMKTKVSSKDLDALMEKCCQRKLHFIMICLNGSVTLQFRGTISGC